MSPREDILSQAREMAGQFPELNLSNYGPGDVEALNAWGLEITALLSEFATAPTPPAAEAPRQEPVADEIERVVQVLRDDVSPTWEETARKVILALNRPAPTTYADAEAKGEIPRPIDEWHEDFGPVVWWSLDPETGNWRGEPAFIGDPLGDDWFENYYTHWTPHPAQPARPTAIRSLASPAPKGEGQ